MKYCLLIIALSLALTASGQGKGKGHFQRYREETRRDSVVYDSTGGRYELRERRTVRREHGKEAGRGLRRAVWLIILFILFRGRS